MTEAGKAQQQALQRLRDEAAARAKALIARYPHVFTAAKKP